MAQLLFLLQTVGLFVLAVDPLTAVSLAASCCTQRWTFFFYSSLLAEGPSNGSMMARQLTFKTVAEKGQFFKGLPSADDNARYCAVLFVVCVINIVLPTKQGVGFGQLWKTHGLRNYRDLQVSPKSVHSIHNLLKGGWTMYSVHIYMYVP